MLPQQRPISGNYEVLQPIDVRAVAHRFLSVHLELINAFEMKTKQISEIDGDNHHKNAHLRFVEYWKSVISNHQYDFYRKRHRAVIVNSLYCVIGLLCYFTISVSPHGGSISTV